MVEDAELLARYAGQRSESAFAELVRRHLNVVHATALRLAGGDAHLAQDITQTVFIELARQAPRLAGKPLAGWLHTTTRFTAAKTVRSEVRRRQREQESCAMNVNDSRPETNWDQLRPVLDTALGELSEHDREAVLLRYFHGREFRAVGAALGVSEDAARMRVDRALEKLRLALKSRGLVTSGAALAAALAACSPPASAELLAAVTQSALAGASTVSALSSVSILKTLSFMTTTSKIAVSLAALIVLGAAAYKFSQPSPSAPPPAP